MTCVVLTGDEIIADERYLIQTLVQSPQGDCTFLAVGSGTITDITRFVSHRTRNKFISLPTAPSVDGFTSIGAPLVLKGVKLTINCQAPVALFADLGTLCRAPHRLVAAGFGDMVGKFTALADWKLGSLVWDEPFDEAIFKRTLDALEGCTRHTQEIGQQSEAGVRHLMAALIESGLCMLDFGNSRPASGAEHHASHYWEMTLLRERRPAVLHGAKVGAASVLVAQKYKKIHALSRQEMLDRLEAAVLPDRDREVAAIRQGYGELADEMIPEHKAFLEMTPQQFDQIKHRIADHWAEIQEIAAAVPSPETIASYLQQVGAAASPAALGFDPGEVERGLKYGQYLRERFTVFKLNQVLGL